MGLTIKEEKRRGDILVISMAGNVDMSTVSELEENMKEITAPGGLKLVLDFSALEFMSSAGWGALVFVKGKLSETGGGIAIANMNEDVARAHDIMGLEAMLASFGSVDEAMRSLGS